VIVVDTNVIADLWLPSADTPRAERLLRTDAEWCVPLLWRSEFRSVLSGLVRRQSMSLDAALRTASDAERQFNGREYAVPADRVLQAAVDSGCSSYDCEFVVLAMLLGVPLVTADRQVLKAFPGVAVSLANASHER
jgi:predicted nucleic acid-binding protein